MGTKYTTTAVSGYNASPPADDGSQVASNQVLWSTIKTKLPDPIKTALESINSKLVTALDTSITLTSTTYNTLAGDHAKTIQIASTTSPAVTINLGDAATMAAGYYVTINNQSAYTATVGRVTSGDTINGAAANVTIAAGGAATFKVNSAANGYLADSNYLSTSQTLTWVGPQRVDPTSVTDGTINMNTANDFVYTPSATDTLEFSNEAEGQRGMIYLDNSSGYTISLGAEVLAGPDVATDLSTAGKYVIAYWCQDGTNVSITYSQALT